MIPLFSSSSPTFSDGYSSDEGSVHSPLFSMFQGSAADTRGTSLSDILDVLEAAIPQRLGAITGAIDLQGYILTPAVTSMLALSDRQDILNYRPLIKYLYHSHSDLLDADPHSYGIKRDYGISYIPQGVGYLEKLSVVSFISAGTISYIAGFSFIIVRHTLRYAISAGI